MKFLTDFTYRNLHGFARFLGDSTALVLQTDDQLIKMVLCTILSNCVCDTILHVHCSIQISRFRPTAVYTFIYLYACYSWKMLVI